MFESTCVSKQVLALYWIPRREVSAPHQGMGSSHKLIFPPHSLRSCKMLRELKNSLEVEVVKLTRKKKRECYGGYENKRQTKPQVTFW